MVIKHKFLLMVFFLLFLIPFINADSFTLGGLNKNLQIQMQQPFANENNVTSMEDFSINQDVYVNSITLTIENSTGTNIQVQIANGSVSNPGYVLNNINCPVVIGNIQADYNCVFDTPVLINASQNYILLVNELNGSFILIGSNGVKNSVLVKQAIAGQTTLNLASINAILYISPLNAPSLSFFQELANYLNGVFPEQSTLSTPIKFGIVFLTMFLITLLVYFLAYKSVGINGFVHIIVLVLNIVLFFYFTSISYIPLGLIIILVVTLLILASFRLLNSSGN